MERHVGLFAAAVLFYVISLVEVAPGFVSPTISLPAKASSGCAGVGHCFQGSRQTSQAWTLGLKTTSVLLTLGACAASRRTSCRTSSRTRIGIRAVEMGSPADLFMQVLRDAAAKKGESVAVTKDLMKTRKALNDQSFLMEVDQRTADEDGNEYVKATKAIEMLEPLESTVFPKFWQFLAKKNRSGLMVPTMDHYIKTLYEAESIAPVRVTTGTPLSDADKEALKEKLKTITGASDVKMAVIVDTKFVAGFLIEYDFIDPDNMINPQQSIDMTMANHINLSALKKGVVGMD